LGRLGSESAPETDLVIAKAMRLLQGQQKGLILVPAKVRQNDVGDHPVQPGLECGSSLKGGKLVAEGEKNLLGQVFGGGHVASEAQTAAVDKISILCIKNAQPI